MATRTLHPPSCSAPKARPCSWAPGSSWTARTTGTRCTPSTRARCTWKRADSRRRQSKPEDRAPGLGRLVGERATVLLDHGAAQAQAQTHAFCLGGEEGGEKLLAHRFAQAVAVVGDGEFDPDLARRAAAGGDFVVVAGVQARAADRQREHAQAGGGRRGVRSEGLHAVARE